ncbi:MAG: N-formylglutamate amidohydrolase [Rhodospirillales bacterium]|nr:N-formylglutamate amidohydrolase [Rhodospirillales bacterium]
MKTDFPELSALTLIGENDPPAYEVINPDGAASMLLICDHASRAFPKAMERIGLDESVLDLHIAWDIGAADVTRRLSQKLDAAAVLAGYSRLLIDVNRQPGDPGSIPEISDTTTVPGNLNLSEAQQLERVESFFWPYHHALANSMAHLWRRGVAPALFSIHSFTPSLGGKDRYWDIGVLWNRDPRLAVPLLDKLKTADGGRYHVGDNEPYSGKEIAYTIDLHAGAAGLPNCAVEIRQDLIETPQGAQHWADILADAFTDILANDNLHKVEHF